MFVLKIAVMLVVFLCSVWGAAGCWLAHLVSEVNFMACYSAVLLMIASQNRLGYINAQELYIILFFTGLYVYPRFTEAEM